MRSSQKLSGHGAKSCIHSGDLLHDIGAIDHTECNKQCDQSAQDAMVAGLYFHEIRENEIRPEGDCRKT